MTMTSNDKIIFEAKLYALVAQYVPQSYTYTNDGLTRDAEVEFAIEHLVRRGFELANGLDHALFGEAGLSLDELEAEFDTYYEDSSLDSVELDRI